MHAAIRMYRVTDMEAFVDKVEQEFVSQVRTVDGFVGYYLIDGGDGSATAVTVGETRPTVDAASAQAEDWVVANAAHLVESAPDITAGEVRIHVER